jgi:HK97 family phage major capsid protein
MAESIILRSGPRLFTASGGVPIRVPKLVEFPIGVGTGASATYWVGESEPIGQAEATFSELVLLPSSLRSIKVIHRVSAELARHAVIDVVNVLRSALVRRIALALDSVFIAGTGDNDTPLGILNTPGTQSEDYGAGGPTVDDLIDARALAMAANAEPNVWFVHPDDFTTLAKQREDSGAGPGTGQYLLQPDPTEAATMRLLGIPARVSTQVPAGQLVLADMRQVAVARDVDASVAILRETFATTDEVGIRVVSRWDVGLLNPEGVVVLQPAA